MRVKAIEMEVFQDYKKAAMLIACVSCDWKCLIENNLPLSTCQNCKLAELETVEMTNERIIELYGLNTISSAIIFGGLEPMLQSDEILDFIKEFRKVSDDDIVIYTGYNADEVLDFTREARKYTNIIMKYGRFVPNSNSRYDDVLGVNLVSDNQYADKIS